MKFPRKTIIISFTIFFIIVLVWNAYLYTLPSHTTQWNYYYNIAYGAIAFIGGGLAIFYGKVFSFKSNIGKVLLYLGLGLLSWASGLVIWVYYNNVLNVEVPYPSWSDYAGFMFIYPFITIGCFYILMIYKSLITKNVLRDTFLILGLSFIIIFGFFSRPDLSEGVPLVAKIFNIYYPVGDMICLALVLMALRIGGGKIHPSLYIFFLGLLLQVGGDLLYSYTTAKETYWNGDLSDLIFTLAMYFMSLGIFEIIYNLGRDTVKSAPAQQITQTGAVPPIPISTAPIPAAATPPTQLPPKEVENNNE